MTSDTLWTEAERLQEIEISLIRQVMNNAPPDAINLALGELAFPLPNFLKQAAIKLIREGNAVYTPNAGLFTLREAVAEYYADSTTATQICICNGAEEAVYLTLLSLINPRDWLAIPDPDYPAYSAIAGMMGAKVVRLPLAEDLNRIDWKLWESLLTPNIKALLLSTPSNPSGLCFSRPDLEHLAAICNEHNIIVIVDEIYKHLYLREPQASPDQDFNNLIRIGGLSKSHCMSGWRLGWINAPLKIAPALIKAKQYVSTCAPWLSQKLAEIALSTEGWKHSELIRQRLARHQALALEILKDTNNPILAPPAGPYLMLKISGDDLAFTTMAAQKGVICVPGSAFGRVSQGWIRLNFGVVKQDLIEGFTRLKKML